MIVCDKCGAVDDYNTVMNGPHKTAWCNVCSAYIKHIEQEPPKMYIGKYKGRFIHEITDLEYLIWVSDSLSFGKRTRQAILDRIKELQEKRK